MVSTDINNDSLSLIIAKNKGLEKIMQQFSIARTMRRQNSECIYSLAKQQDVKRVWAAQHNRLGNSSALAEHCLIWNTGKDQDQHACNNILSTSFMTSQREDLQKKKLEQAERRERSIGFEHEPSRDGRYVVNSRGAGSRLKRTIVLKTV